MWESISVQKILQKKQKLKGEKSYGCQKNDVWIAQIWRVLCNYRSLGRDKYRSYCVALAVFIHFGQKMESRTSKANFFH